jgi:zinc protease
VNRSFGLLIAASLALATAAPAQTSTPARKAVWESGLTVVSETDPSSPVTVLELIIRGGRRVEPEGREGLSYLTTRLCLEIPDEDKARELMEHSSRYLMAGRGDETLIHIECLTEFLDRTLTVLVRILDDPIFSGLRIEHVREFMDSQRLIESDDNLGRGRVALFEALLGPFGYGGSAYGTKAGLAGLRARDVRAFYDERFAGPNMILVAISDLGTDELDSSLRKHFGSFKAGTSAPPQPAAGPTSNRRAGDAPRETIIVKDSIQALVGLGYLLPAAEPRSYAAAVLLESLLGKGPGSRLWPLRSERKLAYNVNARAEACRAAGLFAVYLETDGAKLEEARRALGEEMRRVWEEGVSADELAAARAYARTDILRSNEPKGRRVSTLGQLEALGLGAERFARLPAEMDAIGLEEMNAFIRRTLDPKDAWLVRVGPDR